MNNRYQKEEVFCMLVNIMFDSTLDRYSFDINIYKYRLVCYNMTNIWNKK